MTAARTMGASDVPTVLGLSPYADSSEWALWARLTGLDDHRSPDTPAQARGRMMEPGILLRMASDLGLRVFPNNHRWYPDGEFGTLVPPMDAWRHATPDGTLWDPDDDGARFPVALAECKALRFLDGWGDTRTDQVRVDYVAQCVWQMACTGIETVHVGAFGTYYDEWRLFTLERDHVLEQQIIGKVYAWWTRHVVGNLAPDYDDSPAAARSMARAYSDVTGERVQATTADRELVRRLRTIDEHLDEVKSRRQRLRNQLQGRLGTATHLLHGPDVLARVTKPDRRGTRRLTIIREKDGT